MNNTSVDQFNAFYKENVIPAIEEVTNVASQFANSGVAKNVNTAVKAVVKQAKFDNYISHTMNFNPQLGGGFLPHQVVMLD